MRAILLFRLSRLLFRSLPRSFSHSLTHSTEAILTPSVGSCKRRWHEERRWH